MRGQWGWGCYRDMLENVCEQNYKYHVYIYIYVYIYICIYIYIFIHIYIYTYIYIYMMFVSEPRGPIDPMQIADHPCLGISVNVFGSL